MSPGCSCEELVGSVTRVIAILSQVRPCTILQIYELGKSGDELSYAELAELSGCTRVYYDDMWFLSSKGLVNLEYSGRKYLVSPAFLTGDSNIDRHVLDAIEELYNNKSRWTRRAY